jgi:hypothetical protein
VSTSTHRWTRVCLNLRQHKKGARGTVEELREQQSKHRGAQEYSAVARGVEDVATAAEAWVQQ